MAWFEAKCLEKKWDSVSVSLSFSLEQKDFLCIVGPSGSGKSTVLRMIAGILKSDSPETKIILDGKNITDEKLGKRNCGMVFQNGSLFMNLNVEDNVAYGLVCRGLSKKEGRAKASQWLSMVNMNGFEKRMPATLSGGEMQRVALARTLIVSPKLLLLDEPLSAVDAPLRAKLCDDILRMKEELGFTAIMVTHDLEEAKRMSTKIIRMEKGRAVWQGNASDFLR